MPEYIEREALLKKLCDDDPANMEDYYYNAIANLPTADVAEVKHGEWIYCPETLHLKSGYTCSVCKDPMWHSPDVPQAFNFCPNCGAKMA